MTKLLLIRHGHSISNETGRFTGQLDHDLTEIGRTQASRLADHLQNTYKINKLYTSDLVRAVHTIQPYTDRFPEVPLCQARELREIYGGAWQGLTAEEIGTLYPDEYRIWKNDIGAARPTGGEAVSEVFERASSFVSRISCSERGTLGIVTHAVVIRSLVCAFRNLPLDELKNIPFVKNCSVTEVDIDEGVASVKVLGYDGHLPDLQTSISAGF